MVPITIDYVTPPPPVIKSATITLSVMEIRALLTVLCQVGGDTYNSPRAQIDKILTALETTKIKPLQNATISERAGEIIFKNWTNISVGNSF